jgi:hypothetical protein
MSLVSLLPNPGDAVLDQQAITKPFPPEKTKGPNPVTARTTMPKAAT